jgi:hypothetical protein
VNSARFEEFEELLRLYPELNGIASECSASQIYVELMFTSREALDGSAARLEEAIAAFIAAYPEIQLEER